MARTVKLVLTLVLAACAAFTAAGGAAASIPQSAMYDVQLTGSVNGLPFAREGGMAVGPTVTRATTNRVNPIDLCLGSGSPFISPERGAIWFSTNSICVNSNGARLDLAFVTADRQASTVTIRPDPSLSATGSNGFNGDSGFTAAVWQIFDGTMTLRFQGRGEAVSGNLALLGTGAIFHSENTYNATLTGRATELTPAGDIGTSGCAKAKKKLSKAKTRAKRARKRLAQARAGDRSKARAKLKRAKKRLRAAKRRKRKACSDAARTLESYRAELGLR